MTKHVLIVDDEPDIRELLEITLGRMGLNTSTAADLHSGKQALDAGSFNLCLTDMKLPDGNGLSLIEHIQATCPGTPVAVITAFGSMDIAINALKAGAFDFISKPIDLDTLRGIVQAALRLEETIDDPTTNPEVSLLQGASPAMERLRQQVKKLARSQAPVYIHGESGSGKELVARSIHQLGSRAQQPFIAVNCGAIPKELMESEFFGHKKGSFTGATANQPGLFQSAQGGTLFLDEVADLPLEMQVKLLRAIQEKAVRPIGAEQETPVDVRILSASHKNLADEVEHNRFRQDLFFRINVIQVDVPSLRDRQHDITPLALQFLDQYNQQNQTAVSIDRAALQTLERHPFSGNVRELENILERAYTLCENNSITVADLNLPVASSANIASPSPLIASNPTQPHTNSSTVVHPAPAPTTPPATTEPLTEPLFNPAVTLPVFTSLDQYVETIEKDIIAQALEACRWNKTAAAKKLGITFRQLRYKLKKLGLD